PLLAQRPERLNSSLQLFRCYLVHSRRDGSPLRYQHGDPSIEPDFIRNELPALLGNGESHLVQHLLRYRIGAAAPVRTGLLDHQHGSGLVIHERIRYRGTKYPYFLSGLGTKFEHFITDSYHPQGHVVLPLYNVCPYRAYVRLTKIAPSRYSAIVKW